MGYSLLHQCIAKILHEENLANLKPATTPMEPKIGIYSHNALEFSSEEATRFRRILGSLQYLTTMKLDIAFSGNKISQFLAHPSTFHWQLLQRVLRYVSNSPFTGILIKI